MGEGRAGGWQNLAKPDYSQLDTVLAAVTAVA